MKRQMPKMKRYPLKDNILHGNGKEYSEVASEIEEYYQNWLFSSGTTERDFLESLNNDDFCISLSISQVNASISLMLDQEYIIAPLIWNINSDISFRSYMIDAALLLLLVESKCDNSSSKNKIRSFVRANLVSNC